MIDSTEKYRIMIVDDTPKNLQLLESMLLQKGFQVFAFPSGEMALNAITKSNHKSCPHLILLDILMPNIDGYEVCKRLKANPQFQDIPVLFLSALNEPLDKIRAFNVGGVDYVTKPFQVEEVEARIRTQLEIFQQKQKLQQSYEALKKLESLRDNLVHLIIHDMRSPLTGISVSLDTLGLMISEKDSDVMEVITSAKQSLKNISGMVDDILDISRLESNEMPLQLRNGDLRMLAQKVLELCKAQSEQRRLILDANESIFLPFDENLIYRALCNLVFNAIKFTAFNGEIRIHVQRIQEYAQVTVIDNGPGIPLKHRQKIFEKFGQVQNKKDRIGTGLGLTFCKMAVEAHRGSIDVESEEGQGSKFWFKLPIKSAIPVHHENIAGEPITVIPK